MTDPARLSQALSDRYLIDRELGAGGMATVYLAHDVKHDRNVALKVLRPDLAAALGPERFLREIDIAAQLSNRHILPLLDSGQVDGLPFYVMPYVAGASLRGRLSRETQLPVDDALAITRDVAAALSYAHAEGLVHRDIKPANILLGHDDTVKVTDFGISDLMSALVEGEHDSIFGTPGFMPPEVLYGDDYSKVGDLFSLGVTLYVCLTGIRPFEGSSLKEIIRRTLFSKVKPPIEVCPKTPPELARLIMSLLEKKSAKRISSADLVVEILQGWAQDRGIVWKLPDLDDLLAVDEPIKNPTQWIPTKRIPQTGS